MERPTERPTDEGENSIPRPNPETRGTLVELWMGRVVTSEKQSGKQP